MGYFPETIAAALAGRTVARARLVHFDFSVSPRRTWEGIGPLVTSNPTVGQPDLTWEGTGELVAISDLEAPTNLNAPQATFTVSGVDERMMLRAANAREQVKDRLVRVYLQFFEIAPQDATRPAWSLLDRPFAIWTGRMDTMIFDESEQRSTITLTAESRFVRRRRPAFGLYTDRDQQSRFPGDRGLEQVAALASKTIRWPFG